MATHSLVSDQQVIHQSRERLLETIFSVWDVQRSNPFNWKVKFSFSVEGFFQNKVSIFNFYLIFSCTAGSEGKCIKSTCKTLLGGYSRNIPQIHVTRRNNLIPIPI